MSTTREIIRERTEAARQVHLRYALKQATLALSASKAAGHQEAVELLQYAVDKLRCASQKAAY